MKMINKINKKAGDYRITAAACGANYAFIIDGSINRKDATSVKWYISNLKWALKKYLLEDDVINAVQKANKYVNNKFKSTKPKVSLGVYKKKNDKLEILLVNEAKCYLKTNKVELIENDKIVKVKNKLFNEVENHKLKAKDLLKTEFKDLYSSLESKEHYVYGEVPYDEVYSALLCNEGFANYQRYLEFDNKDFYTLVSEQGVRYCYDHLKRIEERDEDLIKLPRFNYLDDIVAVHQTFL